MASRELLIDVPQDGESVLTPVRVLRAASGRWVTEPAPQDVPGDGLVSVYFVRNGELVSQAAQVAPDVDNGRHVWVIETLGTTTSLEKRKHYRVSCVGRGLWATLGLEGSCEVVDLSETGFGVCAASGRSLGQTLHAVLHHAGLAWEGDVVIRSLVRRGERVRYGVTVADDTSALSEQLPDVCSAVQREVLRSLLFDPLGEPR